jgi:adenosylcobinamide-phosphate synthase
MSTNLDTTLGILGLAWFFDLVVGEYPSVLHPVVWMGRFISAAMRLAPAAGWWRQFFFGGALTLLLVGSSAGLAWLAMDWTDSVMVKIVLGAYLLKASFALRALGRAAQAVVKPLEAGNLPAARLALRSLCSRPVDELNREELLAATIESVAENTSDSLVAPLFYFVLLGVPGAVAYRAINTLDAMIGYRGRFEALGKCAARLDDLVNFIPARITALFFLAVGWCRGGKTWQGWRILRRDGKQTPSPNAGRPMAAMAGLLEVQLAKSGAYTLGDVGTDLTPAKVNQAWRIVVSAAGLTVLCTGLAFLVFDL